MKVTLKTLIAGAMIAASLASHATTKETAEKYLRATQVPEMLQAQVEGYTNQYAKGQDEASRKRIYDYLERVMGWQAIKDEYISLVQDTYTEQEINAFIKFTNTPAGRSMTAKSTVFASKMATLSAKRMQSELPTPQDASESGQGNQSVTANDLEVFGVERFQSGDQIYFTGQIKNNGKKVLRGVNVEANLFRGEHFVDQYSTYISGAIPPGTSRFFKVSCGCKGSPPADHDSFKLQAIVSY
jgi:hypothetical protein